MQNTQLWRKITKMKSTLLYVIIAMAVMTPELADTTTTPSSSTPPPTTGSPGVDLNGKMFTLSYYGGGLSLYPPSGSVTSDPFTRDTTTYPSTDNYTSQPWTTVSPTKSVSVCLRYVTDQTYYQIFILRPHTLSLTYSGGTFVLSWNNRFGQTYSLNFSPNLRFLSGFSSDIWTSVCVTMDMVKQVAQVFSDRHMSIRKRLPEQFVWAGPPVIDISNIEGQVTDVQVWDYLVNCREIRNYMFKGFYWSYRGSALTWSDISFGLRGNTLLEDVYVTLANQPIRRERGRQRKGGRKMKKTVSQGGWNKRKREKI